MDFSFFLKFTEKLLTSSANPNPPTNQAPRGKIRRGRGTVRGGRGLGRVGRNAARGGRGTARGGRGRNRRGQSLPPSVRSCVLLPPSNGVSTPSEHLPPPGSLHRSGSPNDISVGVVHDPHKGKPLPIISGSVTTVHARYFQLFLGM